MHPTNDLMLFDNVRKKLLKALISGYKPNLVCNCKQKNQKNQKSEWYLSNQRSIPALIPEVPYLFHTTATFIWYKC